MRKQLFWILPALLLLAMPAWSASAKKPSVLQGVLMDNACVQAHSGNLQAYAATHSKTCALKPESQKSGYSLLTKDDQLLPFTKKSAPLIIAFLQKDDSRMEVEITYKKAFKYLKLVSIKNQL